jgi:hypothetical protein
MTKDQYLGFQRGPRPEQSDQRQPDQAASFSHKAEALRDSVPVASRIRFPTGTTGYENIRDSPRIHPSLSGHRICAKPFQLFAPRQATNLEESFRPNGGYAMFVDRIKSPRCPKCGAMMSLQVIEPEGPGFDLRTLECPKCYGTETFVASISREIDVSIGPA